MSLVLLAKLCPECNAVLPVACDEPEALAGLRVEHGDEGHSIFNGTGEEIVIWRVSDGGVSFEARAGQILRVGR